mmetsp:Transcript_11832/g.22385  ORF Transcript_11832/g.22385 Transcript_11832/m.22385 type:complete len:314 (-) Transcript_11832:1234-2175(-)
MLNLNIGNSGLVRHGFKLLEELVLHTMPLVDCITKITNGLSHLFCLSAIHRFGGDLVPVAPVKSCAEWLLGLQHFLRVILIEQCITELVVGHLPIVARVEVLHDNESLFICQLEAVLLKSLFELSLGENSVVIAVKLPEDVADEWELLPHALAQLLKHSREVQTVMAILLAIIEFPSVLIHVADFKPSIMYRDDFAGHQIFWLVDSPGHLVEVHVLLQKLASDNAEVPLWWLMDRQRVIEEVEVHDEESLRILRLRIAEPSSEPQYLAVVPVELVEVLLWSFRDQVKHRGHGVIPRAEASVWRRCRPRYSSLR